MRRTLILVLSIWSTPAAPQGAPVRALAAPDVAFPDAFSSVAGVRPLGDGRVIVADPTERLLVLLDPRERTRREIGSTGSGPLEWQRPSRLYALGGDSTLVLDPPNSRFLLLDPRGIPMGTRPQPRIRGSSAPGSTVSYTIAPRRMDASGRLYAESPAIRMGPDGMPIDEDSVALLRLTGSERIDTIAWLAQSRMRTRQTTATSQGGVVMSRVNPLAARDEWTVSEDGTVAIVRASPYRVEWITADGVRSRGPSVNHTPARVTEADRRRFAASGRASGASVASIRMEGGPGGSSPGGTPVQLPPPPPPSDWPEHKPPFLAGAASVLVRGASEIWVQRTHEDDARYELWDVFARGGGPQFQVRLAPGARLIALSDAHAYTTTEDADGLITLRRHPLP